MGCTRFSARRKIGERCSKPALGGDVRGPGVERSEALSFHGRHGRHGKHGDRVLDRRLPLERQSGNTDLQVSERQALHPKGPSSSGSALHCTARTADYPRAHSFASYLDQIYLQVVRLLECSHRDPSL
jgi:hypothetical protein